MKGHSACTVKKEVKVPLRSNLLSSRFLHFPKVDMVFTYQSKPIFIPRARRPFFSTVFLEISSPPLIEHVPTVQHEAWG